jgi:hypothetical protein
VLGGALVLAVAEVSDAPSALVAHALPGGEVVAQARYPLGEGFVALGEGVLVTTPATDRLSIRRVEVAARQSRS